MKLLALLACFLAGSGQTLDQGYLLSPNVEYTFKYTSPNLMKALRKSVRHVSSFDGNSLKLVAKVKVQVFDDMTLRVKLDQIQFYSNGSIVSHEIANQILRDETSNTVTIDHNAQIFKPMLTTPFLLHVKRGVVKKMSVSQNEPAEVTEIKKLLVSNLEKKSSNVHLQLLNKTAIINPLETPRFPTKVDIDASTFLNDQWQSNGESGPEANRRNSVRGVGNVTRSFISSETNGYLVANKGEYWEITYVLGPKGSGSCSEGTQIMEKYECREACRALNLPLAEILGNQACYKDQQGKCYQNGHQGSGASLICKKSAHTPVSAMFQARLAPRSVNFKSVQNIVQSLEDLVDIATLKFASTGIEIQISSDRFNFGSPAMVLVSLKSSVFENFLLDVSKPLQMTLHLETVHKLLEAASSEDLISIKYKNKLKNIFGSEYATIKYETPNNEEVSSFDLPLIEDSEDSEEPKDIPEINYVNRINLPSSTFQRVIRDMSRFGVFVEIACKKDGLTFSVTGGYAVANIKLAPTSTLVKKEDAVTIECQEPIARTFAFKYLNIFTKASSLSSQVTLSIDPEGPLCVEYKNEDIGNIRYMLASE